MPFYDSDHIEYTINSGRIMIVTDSQQRIPAYWSHPQIGTKFSGIALLHDWWGFDESVRRLAHFFAQMGYYVIVPDLFEGKKATTPKQAIKLVEQYKDKSYEIVDATLGVLESHNYSNKDVAAIGVGMGGSLAFEAAIKRDDLEAAIAYGGFPQSYLGEFHRSNTPILAMYGTNEAYIKPIVLKHLLREFLQTPLKDKHKLEIIEGLGHEFFHTRLPLDQHPLARQALDQTLHFLETYLKSPAQPPDEEIY